MAQGPSPPWSKVCLQMPLSVSRLLFPEKAPSLLEARPPYYESWPHAVSFSRTIPPEGCRLNAGQHVWLVTFLLELPTLFYHVWDISNLIWVYHTFSFSWTWWSGPHIIFASLGSQFLASCEKRTTLTSLYIHV